MKKRGKDICLILIIAVLILGVIIFLNKKENNSTKQELYSTIYYFDMGSRKVKIYDNGDVYEDLEIEDPNHKEDYQFVKTLSKEQLNNINKKLKDNSSNEEIDSYIIKEVYGVNKFGSKGQY